jgi:hypothetical protein
MLASSKPSNDLLVVVHAACDEAQQVVVAAADQVAFHDLVDLADAHLELDEVFALVVLQRDLGEHQQRVAELLEPEVRAVAGDVAGLLQPLHADQAGAGRQADGVGEVDVGHAPVLLQLAEDAQVEAVELGL